MADADEVIKAGKLVELRYTMRDPSGKYLDGSGDGSETYTHGSGAIVRGLERALEGKRAGDTIAVTLRPDEAYGSKKKGPGPQPIPRGTFPPEAELKIGMKFQAESPDGRPLDLYIARVERREVFVDTNHPFAGMSLCYQVEVVSVKSKR
jgi:FKBP-type peptidyl-prolyl cis-trans isomerase SlyD